MKKTYKGIIENYTFLKNVNGDSIVIGEVNGKLITTSLIIRTEGKRIETLNSIYQLGKEKTQF